MVIKYKNSKNCIPYLLNIAVKISLHTMFNYIIILYTLNLQFRWKTHPTPFKLLFRQSLLVFLVNSES